jgi:hypothetical protein
MGSNPAASPGQSETSVNRRQGSTTRGQLAALLIAGAAIAGLFGCSPGADYPSIFSTGHDLPPPPTATMNTDQVQQATEALITDRDHLNAQAQGAAGQDNSQNPANSSAKAKAAAAKKKPARETEAAAGAAPASAATGAQTAGAESK